MCAALGFANPHKSVVDHVEEDDLTKREVIDSVGRKQHCKGVAKHHPLQTAGGRQEVEEVIKAFKAFVQAEAKKCASEFPPSTGMTSRFVRSRRQRNEDC